MKSLVPWKWGRDHGAPSRTEQWFGHFWDDPWSGMLQGWTGGSFGGVPSVDVSEDKKHVNVRAELAGLSEKDVELTYEDGVLRLHGHKQEEKEDKGKDRYIRECRYGNFSRVIPVGRAVEWEKARASYKNGVLTVKLPKKEHAAREIKIS